MKQFYSLFLLLTATTVFAQAPSGYYDSATGTGYTLKTQLFNIINADDDNLTNEWLHQNQGDNIDPLYATSDIDSYYENDGSILDIYSEIPSGSDNYNYTYGSDECGNYNSEGDCYNKEHIIPQSAVNDGSPMIYDAHHIVPTDGRVNGFRSNYPFGVVDNSQLVSQSGISNPTTNGSKLGGNLNSGYSAGYTGTVFEPIDEFKGDVARMYFYFVTRYEDQMDNWAAYAMFDGSNDKSIADPFLSILLTWHQMDPVSDREINRNNAVFGYQNNRNPFVDHPEWVAEIWNATPDTEAPTAPTNLAVTNEASNSIALDWTASTDNIGVTAYDVYVDAVFYMTVTTSSATVSGLTPETTYSFYVIAKDAADNESPQSNTVNGTTTAAGSTGDDCGTEDFENIPPNSSQYTFRTWTGDNGQWNATEARTDQSINNRAILVDFRDDTNGVLTSPTVNGGIASLTVTTQRIYSGTDGSLNVLVNGNVVGTVAYSDTAETFTISDINIEGNVTIEIQDNDSGDARVGIDDLSWTCYSTMSVDDKDLNQLYIYPNPVSGSSIMVSTNQSLEFEVYNILGKLVKQGETTNGTISVQMLNSGVYIIKLSNGNQQITKKLIKK